MTPSQVFHRLAVELDFPVPDGVAAPRAALATPLRSRSGACCAGIGKVIDPASRLYRLATFMGHVSPLSTAVYLQITPQLLAQGAARFEAHAEPVWSKATP
jgi:hypothetical protein